MKMKKKSLEKVLIILFDELTKNAEDIEVTILLAYLSQIISKELYPENITIEKQKKFWSLFRWKNIKIKSKK